MASRRQNIGIAAVVFVCVFFAALLCGPSLLQTDVAFNQTTWLSHGAKTFQDQTLRRRMVRSLVARHQLVGMQESEITSLLGPPTARQITPNTLGYDLSDELDSDARLDVEIHDGKVIGFRATGIGNRIERYFITPKVVESRGRG